MRALGPLIKAARWAAAGQLPDRLRQYVRTRQHARHLAASPLFDAGWYRRCYPDIADADPALHYLLVGAAEGRSPGPDFDGEWYLRRHPDVLMQGENPLLHYIERGRSEGRAIASVECVGLPRLPLTDGNYRSWIAAYDRLNETHRDAIRNRIAAIKSPVFFSVMLLGLAPSHSGSVLASQIYPHWELLGSDSGDGATNARGDFLVFLPPGVVLAETALFEMAMAIEAVPATDLLYADEDRIGPDGLRGDPDFKPEWDPDLAQARDLIGPTGAYRRELAERIGLPEADTLPDFARHCAAAAGLIRHVPAVLFHRTSARRDSPPRPRGSGRSRSPSVTAIIPTRDRARLLARCVEGLLHRTDYPSLDIIIVDNDSRERRTARLLHRMRTDPRVRVLPFPGPFNWSAMNNLAVRETPAEIVLLLNNDIDVIAPGWLAEMVQQAIRPDVGIVGAKLLYPDGSVQHAGIVLGPAGAAAHLMRHADRDDPGYQGQLVLPRTVSAVTGACMAMRRSVFLEVGGLEETELRVAYNDIDLCLRVREKGYRVVFAPGAELFHLEAASRGLDVSPEKQLRARQEREYMVRRWGPLVDRDPYLSPNLCVVNERLALASPPGRFPARE